jgi:hypothetical protein
MSRVLVPLAVAAFLVAAPAARAADVLAQAAQELQRDPVYVAPNAKEPLTSAQERRVENEIPKARSGPVYIAVLPASAAIRPQR